LLFHCQIQHVDEFIQHVNVSMRQRHEYKQLSIVVDRIESYDAIDLPTDECLKVVFIPGFFCWGGNSPTKKTNNSPTAARLCALNLFLSGTVNYKYITEIFF